MQSRFPLLLLIGSLLTSLVVADDSSDELIKQYHKKIEGTWRVVALEVNGEKSAEEDAKKITVINGNDGSWVIRSEEKEVARGTSTIYPTQKPPTIDLKPTEGDSKGQVLLGIYELGDKKRKLCFAPAGKERPTEFASKAGTEHILVTFEREKAN